MFFFSQHRNTVNLSKQRLISHKKCYTYWENKYWEKKTLFRLLLQHQQEVFINLSSEEIHRVFIIIKLFRSTQQSFHIGSYLILGFLNMMNINL